MPQHAHPDDKRMQLSWRAHEPRGPAWDAFVDQHEHAHLLQTTAWAELKNRAGWSGFRIALHDSDGAILAGASVLVRSVFGLRIAYVPRGPLTDWADTDLTFALLDAVEGACRSSGATLLKIEPGLHDTMANRLMLG